MTEPMIHQDQPRVLAAGRMTSVMRAVSATTAPRVLRVGIVRAGRIVEERMLKRPETITIGRDESATFVVPDANAPGRIAVLERQDASYCLNTSAPLTGRVALASGVHDLAGLRGRGPIRLDEGARGRVVLGATTLLFQFVPAPPESPRPRLPLSVREGVKLDTALTIIAAFSFLLHFGLVGALYSDWSDPIVDESVTIGELVHLSPMLAPATETLPTETVPDTRPETKKDPAPHDTHDTHDVTPGKHDPSGPSRDTGKRAREEAMARDAKAMGIGILASFGGGSAVDEALTRSQIPVVDLGDAAKADVAVSRGGDDLHLAGDRLVAPSSTHGLQGIAGAKGAGGDGKGKEVEVKPPPATETKIDPIGSTTPVPNAERTISLLRPAFRRCYNRGLQVDPGMAGSVTVRAKIASNGEVAHVEAAQLVGLSSDVSACITKVVQGAQFDSPGPSGSTLDIPVKMIQQAR